jgi:hypothetical protein
MKTFFDRWLRWCRKRLAAMTTAQRLTLAAGAALLAGGLGWLALGGSERMVPVMDRPADASRLAGARQSLSARGIDHRVEGGRLVVPAGRLEEARAAIQESAAAASDGAADLERLAMKEDIWSSQSQIGRRWQAAKMAAMARMIARFPRVRSASVIFEEGEPRGLGGSGVEPTAVVGVDLKAGSAMTAELVDAIADLVSGGVAGMKRQNVRIVESAGRSYRAADVALAESPAMRQIQAAESYYIRKVRSALPRLDGVTVAVRVEPRDPAPRCAEVRIAVPRGHFAAVGRAATQSEANELAVAAGLEQIRDLAAFALGDGEIRVKAECYQDAVEDAGDASAAQADRAQLPWLVWAGVGAAVGVAAAWALRKGGPAAGGRGASKPSSAWRGGVPDAARGAHCMLQWAPLEDILAFLQDEHPQTAAVVLASLPAEKGAAVLDAMPPATRQEVCRRLAATEQIDPGMVRGVEIAISSRLSQAAQTGRAAAGGPSRLAEILGRARPQTRRHVLESLAGDLPQLAQSLRRQRLAFEDIVSLGEPQMSAVLENMDARRLAVALRTASKPLSQKVFACLSSPAARRLRTQMDSVGPVRLSEVESAQQQIVDELAAAGEADGSAASGSSDSRAGEGLSENAGGGSGLYEAAASARADAASAIAQL